MTEVQDKYEALKRSICDLGKVAVAFSGGIDSTFLLTACKHALGAGNVLAVIVSSQFVARAEIADASYYCRSLGVPCELLELDVLNVANLRENPPDRCYICKTAIFSEVTKAADRFGAHAILEGSNFDDLSDYRPGMRAVQELGVKSPLLDAGLSKKEIRELSRELGITSWEKPSSPCLATRFVFGESLDEKRLLMVEDAERHLRDLGFKTVRVRTHGEGSDVLARIELDSEGIAMLGDAGIRANVIEKLMGLGYAHVTLDLQGYRRGSMNGPVPESDAG